MSEASRSTGNLGDVSFPHLCRVGGVVAWPRHPRPWVTVVCVVAPVLYCLATLVQLLVRGGQPATAREAFELLQQNCLVGLLRLDLSTVLALPLYYLVFLGLYVPWGGRTPPA